MQTQMAQALVAAGVKPKPLMERVWHYIRDNPNANLAKVESVYGPSSKQTIHSLYCRKMLTRRIEERRIGGGSMRSIYLYKVAMPEYELLPLPVKPKAEAVKAVNPPKVRAEAGEAVMPSQPASELSLSTVKFAATPPPTDASAKLDSYIDSLTVGEARQLYSKLKAIFN